LCGIPQPIPSFIYEDKNIPREKKRSEVLGTIDVKEDPPIIYLVCHTGHVFRFHPVVFIAERGGRESVPL